MTLRTCKVLLLALVLPAVMASSPVPGDVADQTEMSAKKLVSEALPAAEVVFTLMRPNGVWELYLDAHGQLNRLMATHDQSMFSPVISPNGKKIAFGVSNGDNFGPMDGARTGIIVINLETGLRQVILDVPDHNDSGAKALANGVQGVTNLLWLDDSRIVYTGPFNPTMELGYVVKVDDTPSPVRIPFDTTGHELFDFESTGPLNVSPSGLHLASVGGLKPTTQYESCPSVGEVLLIDGVPVAMPASVGSLSVVSNIAWRDDTGLDFVGDSRRGYVLIKIQNIPPRVVARRSKNKDFDDSREEMLSPPSVAVTALMPSTTHKGFDIRIGYGNALIAVRDKKGKFIYLDDKGNSVPPSDWTAVADVEDNAHIVARRAAELISGKYRSSPDLTGLAISCNAPACGALRLFDSEAGDAKPGVPIPDICD